MITKDPRALLRYWGGLCLGTKKEKLLLSLCEFHRLSTKQEALVVRLSQSMNSKYLVGASSADDKEFNDWVGCPYPVGLR